MAEQNDRGFWRTYAPGIASAALALALTGVVRSIHNSGTFEEKLGEQKTNISELRGEVTEMHKSIIEATQRVDRMDTPLARYVRDWQSEVTIWRGVLQQRIETIDRETTNNTYSQTTDRDLIENLAGRVIKLEESAKKLDLIEMRLDQIHTKK